MTTTAAPSLAPGLRSLPCVLYFEHDDAGLRMSSIVQRYRRTAFEQVEGDLSQGEWILMTGSETLLSEHYTRLRHPNVRIIGICETRFREARIDGTIYSYLPPNTPAPLVERMLENALDHIHLVGTRREANERLANVTREISELNSIGAALSAEHDTERLLDMILAKSRAITHSDAGSLYLVESPEKNAEETAEEVNAVVEGAASPNPEDAVEKTIESQKVLRFKLTQGDSLAIPFKSFTMPLNPKSVAGYVALSGSAVNIEDVYHLADGVPYTFNRKFDEDSGYRTKSVLAVPMLNQKGEVLGVVQLINSKRNPMVKLTSLSAVVEQVVPFTQRQQEIAASLASQAAVALENSRLYQAIQAMLEGFVKASVTAIEARDPTTSGHSFRVSNLTVGLAEAVDRLDAGTFADLHFTRSQMKEIRYAALLHDFGKVGVREEVLVKAKKLYPSQIDLVKQRFQFVKRSVQAEVTQRRLDYLLEKGRDEYLQKLGEFDAEEGDKLKALDDFCRIILTANEPTVLPEGQFEQLLDIAAKHYQDFDGNDLQLLSMDEVRLLSIRKGSLDDRERQQIESHVVHTFNFLKQIPWTKEIRHIPGIARGHHEKLNGLGYPYKLSAAQIPVQTRMMTISDIFDALAAADRPYKRAVPQEKALDILGFAVKDGEIDGDLYKVFLESRVFDKWKIEPFPY
jgi:HD-GYP domain-containing protein (c-di-GMP phosphodiesterase class II)